MMKFFSNGTWRPRAAEITEVPTPVGESCLACGAAIQPDDCGVLMVHMDRRGDAYRPWHLSCFQRSLGIEGASA
jgi:hypothetical protein